MAEQFNAVNEKGIITSFSYLTQTLHDDKMCDKNY